MWETFARLIFGIPADITWRLEQRGETADKTQTRREKSMLESTGDRAFFGGAWLMAGFTVAVTFMVAFGGGESDVAGVHIARPLWAVLGVLLALLILGGVQTSKERPILGGTLVLIGGFPLASMLWWSVVVPVFWLALAVLLIARAFMALRRSRATPA